MHWTQGSSLITPRESHACGKMTKAEQSYVVIVGGKNGDELTDCEYIAIPDYTSQLESRLSHLKVEGHPKF